MILPPFGICSLCVVRRVIDGDTVVVSRKDSKSGKVSSYQWRIRLIDCWANEKNTTEGMKATIYLKSILIEKENVAVFVPTTEGQDLFDLFSYSSLSRVVGRVFLDGMDISEHMVAAGFATKKKPRKEKR